MLFRSTSAESIKKEIGVAISPKGGDGKSLDIKGRDLASGIPKVKEVNALEDGYGITCNDLEEAEKFHDVEIQKGDFVIVRTGQMEAKLKAGSWDGYPGGDAPGFSFETLDWIKEKEMAGLASDTWGCEVRPNESEKGINQPWHWIAIPIMGLTMGLVLQDRKSVV